MKTLLLLTLASTILLLCLTGCAISEDRIGPDASNYVRLSEYRIGYQLYGSLTGCQISAEGEVAGAWMLNTKNCTAQSNGTTPAGL